MPRLSVIKNNEDGVCPYCCFLPVSSCCGRLLRGIGDDLRLPNVRVSILTGEALPAALATSARAPRRQTYAYQGVRAITNSPSELKAA